MPDERPIVELVPEGHFRCGCCNVILKTGEWAAHKETIGHELAAANALMETIQECEDRMTEIENSKIMR